MKRSRGNHPGKLMPPKEDAFGPALDTFVKGRPGADVDVFSFGEYGRIQRSQAPQVTSLHANLDWCHVLKEALMKKELVMITIIMTRKS